MTLCVIAGEGVEAMAANINFESLVWLFRENDNNETIGCGLVAISGEIYLFIFPLGRRDTMLLLMAKGLDSC